MVDLHMKPSMPISNVSIPSPTISSTKPNMPSSTTYSSSSSSSYEQYLRLPELTELWSSKDFPEWKSESIVKPALQALEITFRLVSLVLSDPRPYSDTREWTRRLDSFCSHQIEIISDLLRRDDGIPVADTSSNRGVLSRDKSSQEVWRISGSNDTIVTHTSEASLLPRLAAWDKSSNLAHKISLQIECLLYRCPFTLGLGEPNLAGKPSLEYDLIVRPAALHAIKNRSCQKLKINNQENDVLFNIHHVLESWLCTCKELLREIVCKIEREEWDEAAADCWLLERIWKLLSEVEDLHLMMDPDDFLCLKSQLAIRSSSGPDQYCFRSSALLDVTEMSKNLKHNVPKILGVEVDPNGGPRVQEAAMRLFHTPKRGEGSNPGRLHLLQAFQAIEAAVKGFFFGYQQLIVMIMGSLEATGNRGIIGSSSSSSDSLTQMFMEPPYYPSLDAAKTFLGELWQCEQKRNGLDKSCSLKQ